MAGVPGFEPGPKVLETSMLTIDTIPLSIWNRGFGILELCQNRKPQILFVFSVQRVAAATTAELLELKPTRRVLLVLRRHVIALFALGALQRNVISRHNFYPGKSGFKISNSRLRVFARNLESGIWNSNYSTISDTVPAPTVRPPSRIANRSPFSIAIGAISSISIWMLSPGITISTPAGRFATPVTSVVRK